MLYIERREVSSQYTGRSVSLLYREEIDSFSIKKRECLALNRIETLSTRYKQERETPSLYKGESVSLLYIEEADSFSTQRRECISSI